MKTNHVMLRSQPVFNPGRFFLNSYRQVAFLSVLLIAVSASAASRTWNGGASPDPNWSTAGNWVGGVAPVNGDDVIFINAAGDPLTSSVDVVRSVNSITRNATDAAASLMAVNTLNHLTVNNHILSSGGMTIAGPISLAHDLNIWRASGTGTLLFTNAPGDTVGISGAHQISFTNVLGGSPGAFLLMANPLSTWSGGAYIRAGNVRVGDVSSTGSPGAPTAGPLGTGTVTIEVPGSTDFGVLSFQGSGNLTLHNNVLVNSSGGVANSRRLVNNLTPPLKLTLNGAITNNEDIYLTAIAGNTIRLDGTIRGTGGLVANSAGLNALLTGGNSYAGGTVVLGGANLGFGSDTALGSGTVAFGATAGEGQIFSYAVNGPRAINNNVIIRTVRYIASNGTIDGLAGNDQTFNGTVTLDQGPTDVRDIYCQANMTINGTLAGATGDAALRKIGGGTLYLKGANSYGGGSYILGGTLNINSDAALGADPGWPTPNLTFAGGGGTLQVGAASVALSANRNISLDPGVSGTLDTGGNSLIVNGVISGGGHLFKTGSGTLTLTAAGNDIAGYVFIDGNVLVDGGSFYNGLEFVVGNTAPGTLTINGATASAQSITVRPGTDSSFNLVGGTLSVDQLFAVAPANVNAIATFDGGTITPWGIQPARFDNFISGLSHAYLKSGGLILNSGGQTLTIPQALEHDPALGGAPDGGFTKVGAGEVYLTGTNTYTGPTMADGGRLVVTTAGGSKGDYTVTDTSTLRVKVSYPGSSLTNASLSFGLFMYSTLEIDLNNLGLPTVAPIQTSGALTPGGVANIVVANLASPVPGVFPLIKYGSLDGGGFASLMLAPIPNVTAMLSNDVAHSVIDLVITEVNYPKWKGNVNNDWDISATPNWVGIGNGSPTVYEEPSVPGVPVWFDDTADSGSVNLTTTLSPYSMTVSNSSLNYSFSGVGSLSGPMGLIKKGSAQLTMMTANTYYGANIISGGSVIAAAPNALGSGGALAINGATLNIGDHNQAAGQVTLANGNILGTNGVLAASGYTLASGVVGAHLANGNLTKVGPGTVSLMASNNYGVTEIQDGILRVTDSSALSPGGFSGTTLTVIDVGGALLFDGTISTDEHFYLAGAGPDGLGALRVTNGTVTIAQHGFMPTNATINVAPGATLVRGGSLYTVVTNLLTLTKRGAGDFWEWGTVSTYIPLDVVEGTLGVAGTVSGSVTVRSSGTLSGSGAIGGPVVIEGGGTVAPGASIATLTINDSLTLQGTARMEIAKTGLVTANDKVEGMTTVIYGGNLVVTNLGPDALEAGDTFQLFAAAARSGTFASLSLPPLDPGLAWANNLAVDGTIQVVSSAPYLGGIVKLNDGNFQLSGTGPDNAAYRVFASTNVAQPLNDWVQVGTGTFINGVLDFTDLQSTNYARRFYRVVTP